MRKAVLILCLLLAVSVCSAQVNMTSFITPYLYNGENYTTDVQAVSFNLSYGNYSLVKISSTPTFLLNMSENASFIQNQSQISGILSDYYAISTYPTKAELDYLNSSFNSFVSSRGSHEIDCRVESGLINPDGSHHLTCNAANLCESCRTVPICHDVMYNTLTSPDLMSSPLAQAIMTMEYDFDVIDNNTIIFRNSMANMSSNVSSSLQAIQKGLNSIVSAVADLGSPTISILYQQYTQNPNALGFCYDFYAPYNLTALTNAASKADALAARVPNQTSIHDYAASIANKTIERQLNRTIREQREAFDARYAAWLAEDTNTTTKANFLLSHVQDNETPAELANLKAILSNISTLGDARNYTQVDIAAQSFSHALNLTNSHIDGLLTSYNEMISENSSTSDALFEAGLYVKQDDIFTTEDLNRLYTQKASIEFTMYNESPMSILQVNSITNQLIGLRLDANGIRDEKLSASSVEVNNIVTVIAKPIVSFSMGIISSFMPLSAADKQRNSPTIIAAFLVIADIVIFLAVLAAFFYLVRSKKIELHRVAKVLWAFIFAFFLLLLVLGSLTIYNVANMQSQPTTFAPFISEFRSSARVAVVADLTGATGAVRDSMKNCSAQIASKITSLNKSVATYVFENESCTASNNTLTKSACFDAIDTTPVVILQSGLQNSTTFNVFYTKTAVFKGDENFFVQCPIPKVIG